MNASAAAVHRLTALADASCNIHTYIYKYRCTYVSRGLLRRQQHPFIRASNSVCWHVGAGACVCGCACVYTCVCVRLSACPRRPPSSPESPCFGRRARGWLLVCLFVCLFVVWLVAFALLRDLDLRVLDDVERPDGLRERLPVPGRRMVPVSTPPSPVSTLMIPVSTPPSPVSTPAARRRVLPVLSARPAFGPARRKQETTGALHGGDREPLHLADDVRARREPRERHLRAGRPAIVVVASHRSRRTTPNAERAGAHAGMERCHGTGPPLRMCAAEPATR